APRDGQEHHEAARGPEGGPITTRRGFPSDPGGRAHPVRFFVSCPSPPPRFCIRDCNDCPFPAAARPLHRAEHPSEPSPVAVPLRFESAPAEPLAVVKRRAKQPDLGRVVPEACGTAWKLSGEAGITSRGRMVA